jgi:uncharacterized protein (DUF427 family)
MSILLHRALREQLGDLRYETTEKLVRAVVAGVTAAESTSALLVWEPRRVVPSYAVPVQDLRAELVPVQGRRAGEMPPFLHPGIPFAEHSAAGESFTVRLAGRDLPSAAFSPEDPDLHDHVVLDFGAFDAWYEEDELNVAHPRDPFHRIDVLPSSRQVRLELDGQVLAVSSRPVLLFETMLPTRYYLPRADVTADLVPSSTRTWCAYKGQASYFSASVGGRIVPDIAWSYPDPQHDAARVRDLIAFFDERIDVVLDGERRDRPVTPWSDGPGA